METDAALSRTAQVVVLHPEAAENFHRPVVHAYGDGEMKLAHRPAQQFTYTRLQSECFGYLVNCAWAISKALNFSLMIKPFDF